MNYTSINHALTHLGLLTDSSEVHVILSGLLCANSHMDIQNWFKAIIACGESQTEESANDIISFPDDITDLLTALYKQTLRQLNNEEFGFQPLLLDDDESLADRATALSSWCEGFLYGLGTGSDSQLDFTKIPENAQEIITDYAQLARATHHLDEDNDTSDTDSEEDEVAYNTLVDYVCISTALLYEELNPVAPPTPTDQTIH